MSESMLPPPPHPLPRRRLLPGLSVGVFALAAAAATDACSSSERAVDVDGESSHPPPHENVADVEPAPFVPRCTDGDHAEQRYGATCLCCHSDEFGVGGSVDRAGPVVDRIVITDSVGDVASLAPNRFSNFFRHFPMTAPFRATAYGPDGRSITMKSLAPSADCNACHSSKADAGSAPMIHGP